MEELLTELFGREGNASGESVDLMFIPDIKNLKLVIDSSCRGIYKKGLEIYTPYSLKGKLFKLLLISGYGISKKIFPVKYICGIAANSVMGCIKEFLGRNFYFSVYCARKGRYSKNIIQVFDESGILGYVKYAKSKIIRDKIKNEEKLLQALNRLSLHYGIVPRLMKEFEEGDYFGTMQSQESGVKRIKKRLRPVHARFLAEIAKATPGRWNKWLMEEIFNKDLTDKIQADNSISKPFEKLAGFLDLEVSACLSHGDFTPWNIGYSNKKIYVFDWENGENLLPLGADIFHFLFQSLTLKKKLRDPRRIVKSILKNTAVDMYFNELSVKRETVKLYLLFYFFMKYASMRRQIDSGADIVLPVKTDIYLQVLKGCILELNKSV